MLEVGHDQGEATRTIMQELGYINTRVLKDMSGKARFPLGYAAADFMPRMQEPVTDTVHE